MEFDTKIALVVRKDLETWQKLNVTAFLSSGIVGVTENIIGENYKDANGYAYNPLVIQPMMIFEATADQLTRTLRRAKDRGVKSSVFIEDMFTTAHDEANRQVVSQYTSELLPLVGVSMRSNKKTIDKIIKGLKLHQ